MELMRREPLATLKENRQGLLTKRENFRKALKVRLQNDRQQLASFSKMVDILHPANTMKRGFSITRNKQGKVIKNINDINLKEELTTEILDGLVKSQVTRKQKGSKE